MGCLDEKGILAIDAAFEKASFFFEGFAAVSKKVNGKVAWGVINRLGSVVCDFISPHMVTDSIFVGGLAPAGVKDGMRHKWGFIRPNARFAIEPTFDFAGPFIGGLVAVVASGSAQRFDMYVDVGGRVVWSASP